MDIVLCSWARHITLTVFLSTLLCGFQFSVFNLFTPILTNYVNYNNGKKRQKNKGKVATCALGSTLK